MLNKKLKIIYIGDLNYGATALMRFNALKKIGHDVYGINSSQNFSHNIFTKVMSRILWRLGSPVDFINLNSNLIDIFENVNPDLVWVDKGQLLRRRTIQRLRKISSKTQFVHYNPDDPFGSFGMSSWRYFLEALSSYDFHFVPRNENIEEYESYGAKKVLYIFPSRGFDREIHALHMSVVRDFPAWGYDPNIHQPQKTKKKILASFTADVGFLGAFENDRAEHILYLAKRGIKIRIPKNWPAKYMHENLLLSPYDVIGKDYSMALSCFKICLCFLRKGNRDKHTSRSIEIPAGGNFLLAERTNEHQALFEEDKEAVFFSTPEELYEKVKFYIKNEKSRIKIAQAGQARCHISGYDYVTRMKKMIDLVQAQKKQS
jgi:hypothetical protein